MLLIFVMFGFIHLKMNKFEASHPFIKFQLIGTIYYLITRVKIFRLHIIWIWYEIIINLNMKIFGWKVLDVLTCLNWKKFMKKLNIVFFICNHNWNFFYLWNCTNISYCFVDIFFNYSQFGREMMVRMWLCLY